MEKQPPTKMSYPLSSAPAPKRSPGRIANLFKWNRKKYDALKEEGDKFEF